MSGSESQADRNLLFGVLALQNDFVSREKFLTSFSVWLQDKSRDIADILCEQGLDTDDFQLLKALTKKHLERHGNDAQKSLEALAPLGTVGEQLKDFGDDEIEQSLAHVSINQQEDDVLQTRPGSIGTETSSGQRFKVLRPHDKGGLGVISVARDQELHREVALKEIRPKRADDQHSRLRFQLEAEVTGGLEHPSIVPVYGFGHYADGRPFYAMKFIRGDSLHERVQQFHGKREQLRDDERAMELRSLLGRFIDVCNAIAFSHDRGVLHRDIKPGNIMLGEYGETLVVDWGLACVTTNHTSVDGTMSPLNPPTAQTLEGTETQGQAIGTPQYMSPEQAAGRLDELGPRSDVYSLGATLYFLLTNRPPCTGKDVGPLLRQVQRGDFPRPKSIKSDISPALEAICMMAMANDPQDRYANVKELADDVERWLADESVSAWKEPFSVRARRWARKHSTQVTAAVVGLAVATAASGVIAWKTSQYNAEITAARDLAQANLEKARDAVDKYFTTVSENTLLNEPGLQPLRKELLEDALGFYQELLNSQQDNPDLLAEQAMAHYRVGRILQLTSSPRDALSYQAAIEKIAEALRILDSLPRSMTENQRRFGTFWNAKGDLHHSMKDYATAKIAYDNAHEARRAIANSAEATIEDQRLMANTIMNLGILAEDIGWSLSDTNPVASNKEFEEAYRLQRSAQTLRLDQLARNPNHEKLSRDLGNGFYNLSELSNKLMLVKLKTASAENKRGPDDLDPDSEENHRKAIAAFEKLLSSSEGNLEYQLRRAQSYELLATHHLGMAMQQQNSDLWQTSAQEFAIAMDSMREQMGSNPAVPLYGNYLAGILKKLAFVQRKLGQEQEAQELEAEARQLNGESRNNDAEPEAESPKTVRSNQHAFFATSLAIVVSPSPNVRRLGK